jgi:hypothetical protein
MKEPIGNGCWVGKALEPLSQGTGVIQVLVAQEDDASALAVPISPPIRKDANAGLLMRSPVV